MKTKTINKTITNKVDDWIETIKKDFERNSKLKKQFGENFPNEIRSHVIVTGGCIVSMLRDEKVNDFDIYFDDKDIAKKIAEYYTESSEIKETKNGFTILLNNLIQNKKKTYKKYSVKCITTNAITLSDDIQIITRFVGSPEEIHKNFDFVHTTNYWKNGKIYYNVDALESIITKELKYVGTLYPVASVFRSKKFIGRGWSINAGEMFKMVYDSANLDLTNEEVLRDQLIGVDISFFNSILKKLKDCGKDRDKLFEIIDGVFNETEDFNLEED